MSETQDVVIIGGGVMGTSAAFWLTRMSPGLRVLVIERDPTWARAATALSVASIRQQFSLAVNVRISRFGIEFLRDFKTRIGLADGVSSLGLRENGYLFLTGDRRTAEQMHELALMQRREGAATEVLGPDGLGTRFPWLATSDLVAGSYGSRDEGWFDNMGLLGGLRQAAQAQGARFLTGEADGLRVESGRVVSVGIAGLAPVSCGAAICAAGTRASRVLGWAGLDLPVEPRKRTVFVVDAPNARHPDAPMIIERDYYARPEHQHWITATVPESDSRCDVEDFEPEPQLFEDVIWPQLWHRIPGFDAARVLRFWVGHYDYNTLDQNALLGPHPDLPNLFVMSGFSGHGLQQAPAVGRGIAEHVLTGGWQSIDLSDLSIDRIISGKAMRETEIV